MRLALLCPVLLAGGGLCAPPQERRQRSQGGGEPISTTVDLGYSRYEGYEAEGVHQWLGMRYAAPPTGDLRWRAPQEPPLNDSEVLPATAFAATCLGDWQSVLSDSVNEDCLYLDVFAPANATTESKLPVWFFIQGGGYGGDLDQNFNATEVVIRSNYSMVLVQINYRVGAFGFLASEKVRDNGDLNVGLLDQRFALHWVQKYVHLFGGNPEHVVIHGDSAGAGSVVYHMTAYDGRDDHLFVGGMAESSFWPTHRQVSEMEFQFDRFAANVSCSTDEAPNGDVLACLRSKDTVTLQSADYPQNFSNAPGVALWYFLPVVDGTFSTDYLYNLFEAGKIVRVPLLVGDDTNEGNGFVTNATDRSEFLGFIKDNFPNLSDDDLQRVEREYPQDGFGTFPDRAAYFAALAAAYGENTFTCPGIEISNSLSAYNAPAKVWNYRYNVQDLSTVAAGLGVPHVSEKPAIWGVNNTGACNNCSYETYNAPIVPLVMDYWISFILSLDPNTYKAPNAPVWQPWQSTSQGCFDESASVERLVFQLNDTRMETVPDAQRRRCDFWKSLANITEQ
ncbi:alpha/beta-hydrolase [Xylariaceae sp. FL0804]|nr:alpha/beta-hydrolase [Xylariaceae sp. FL0804]